MAAVILFFVPIFHGLVFAGLAFWFKKSKRPRKEAASKLAAVFAGAGALANIVLCILLLELLSGLSMITGFEHAENGLGTLVLWTFVTQIAFVAVLFPTTRIIFKAQG